MLRADDLTVALRFFRRLAREEQGAFLVEVMVSALLLAMLTGGVMLSFDLASKQSGHQRTQAVAANFAESKLEELRSWKFAQLSGLNLVDKPAQVGDTKLTWDAKGESALAPKAAAAGCDDSARSPEAIKLTVSVRWPQMNGRAPVTLSSVVSAPVGGDSSRGSFTVQIVDREGYGVEDILVKLAGPSTASANTDSNGCVRFTDMLPSLSYALTFQRDNWFTTPDSRNAVADVVAITAGQAGTKSYQYDPGGPLVVDFFSKRTAAGPEIASKQRAVTWESSTFSGPKVQNADADKPLGQSTFTTAPQAYPNQASPYGVYADKCTGAKPTNAPAPQTLNPPDVPKAKVQLPALDFRARNVGADAKVYVISGCLGLNFDSTGSPSNGAQLMAGVFMRDVEPIPDAENPAPNGQKTNWFRLKDPGFPWGSNFYVCVQRQGTPKRWRRTTAGRDNKTYPSTDLNFGDLNSPNAPAGFEDGDEAANTLCGVKVS